MVSRACDCGTLPATVTVSEFRGPSGVNEYHLAVTPTGSGSIERQLDWVEETYQQALAAAGLGLDSAVLRRFFCSDLANQAPVLAGRPFSDPGNQVEPCAVSWTEQPPAPPAKVALWAYHISDPAAPLDKRLADHTLTLQRGRLAHHWTTGLTGSAAGSAYDQTADILQQYQAFLKSGKMLLADDVIRTWFFVQDIDANYHGLVAARREHFAAHGLTADTHYIASTGVGGGHADPTATVTMDAYAIGGVRPEQITFLAALDHLSPTHVYGVTFERGVAVSYADRRHVLISGTASIDADGHILHPGDVGRQLDRTLENIAVLLGQAGVGFGEVGMFIVYVRDPADLGLAEELMRERFGDAPMVVAVAPVCRPGWLIEVECQAVVEADNPGLPVF